MRTHITPDPFQIDNPEQHDIPYFAMLNNAVAVSDTSLEVGNREGAFAYYRYLLNLKLPNCPLELNITSEQSAALQKGIEDLIQIQHLLQKSADNSTLFTKQGMDAVIHVINKNSSESGICYLPSGWSGEPGHFAGLKLRKLENGHYAFSILNHGGGIQYHRKVSKSGYKEKYIYQSDEYDIDLQSEDGRDLLKKLLELKFDTRKMTEDPYKVVNTFTADDLYGLLKLYGKEISLTDKLSKKVVTPQRGGTCTVTNTNAIARDILIDHGADLQTHKRYHFVLKLRSIIAAFDEYKKGRCQRNVLEWALREFAVRLNKEYHHTITDDEMIYCGQLQAEIKQRLDQDNQASARQKCVIKAMPPLQGEAPLYRKNLFEATEQKTPEETPPLKKEIIPSTSRTKIKPEEIVTSLAHTSNFKNTYDIFNSFPHCTGLATDPFWDKVPAGDIFTIIHYLQQIIARFQDTADSTLPQDRARTFAIALMAYDIAAQLAPRVPGEFGDNFQLANRYAFGLDDVYSDQNFFTDPIAYHTVKRIVSNFEQRCQGKERILSNAVNYDNNKFDQTVHYIIRVILTDEQREAVSQSLMARSKIKSGTFTDTELFGRLMEDIYMQYENGYVLDQLVTALMRLSATAHRLGKFSSEFYVENKDNKLWLYHENQFHHELARKEKLKTFDFKKHLPSIESSVKNTLYQDFSENTIYHPRDNLTNAQERFKSYNDQYSPLVQLQPYQIYPSGSLRPDSTIWKLNQHTQSSYEELDEDLRHIECAPNLQISRVFTWARAHLDKLGNPDVRKRINELLFQYGKLDNAFANQLEPTLVNMEQFYVAIINYCKNEAPNDNDLLIWASNLANHLRYHLEVAAKVYHLPIDNVTLPRFRETLLERIRNTADSNVKSELANMVICEFRNTSPLTVDDCCILLTSRMIANLGDSASISDETWQTMMAEISSTLSSGGSQITNTLNQLFPNYLKLKFVSEWKVAGSLLTAKETDFFIDLESGTLKKIGMDDLKECTKKVIAENKKLFDRLHITERDITLFYSPSLTNKTFKSSDGRWEFKSTGGYSTSVIDQAFQFITVDGNQVKFRMLKKSEIKNGLCNVQKNPFESNTLCDSNYQYWHSPNHIFIRQENSNDAYIYNRFTNEAISQLTKNENNGWHRNNTILLNLLMGSAAENQTNVLTFGVTDLEKQWAKRLNPLFGVDNMRCIAALSKDKKTCHLQRIEHLTLGLNFTVNDKQKLMCNEIPGYFLSEQLGLEVLQGLPNMIILENSQGEKKYIMPAFSLNAGEKNNAFNQEDIVDSGNVCNKSQPYYLLTYNRHQELIGDTVEANLYLAILYRSLGDFKSAFQCLNRCKSATNITANTAAIAMQVLNRKIKSPMGAAFDLKLECYLREHQQKWSKDDAQIFEPVTFPDNWNKWIKEQLQFYKDTFSNYKTGVAILPSYCQLTEEEFRWLGQEPIKKRNDQDHRAESSDNIGERLAKASQLHELILQTEPSKTLEATWREHIENLQRYHTFPSSDALPTALSTWRLYSSKSRELSLDYLAANFNSLFSDAISYDPVRLNRLNKTLFSLLQNDANVKSDAYDLIALLAFSSKYPYYFDSFKKPANTFELIINIGDIFSKRKNELKDATVRLIEYKTTTDTLTLEQPLPSDHVAEPVQFALATLTYEQECKHPLEIILNQFFTKNTIPVAKLDFALTLSDIPNATLIEKRLLNQYKKGHEENQSKMKAVYHTKEGVDLADLKTQLDAIIKDDNARITLLESTLLRRANQTPIDHPLGSEKAKAYNILLARASEQRQTITISDLLVSFLHQDPALLTQQNPFLTQKDIEQLYADLSDYALLHSRVDQSNQSLAIVSDKKSLAEIEPYELQLLGGMLDKQRAYEVIDFPEFLVYEYATHRLLREDQVTILSKIIKLIEGKSDKTEDMRHCLLQFAAGGGKTSVLIPILAQRFAQKGLLPVIFNTNELYQIGLEDIPKNLTASFQQNMEVVERELDHQWTEEEFKKLLEDLNRWRKEKKCILLKPVTWHSINLAWKLTCLRASSPCMSAKPVLDFFKNHAVKLEDECHIVSDPLQQSIKTFGKMQKMPNNQLALLLKCYDFIMGHAENSNDIAKLAGIKSNRKRSMTPAELSALQEKLANVIANEPIFKAIPRKDLIAYFLQPDQKRPKWLCDLHDTKIENPNWGQLNFLDDKFKKENPDWKMMKDNNALETADFIIFSRAFLHTHLPHILSLQHQKDYGTSIHKGDLTVAPKHEGKDVTSHFGDHTKVAALTIQMYQQRGLLPAQVEQLLDKLMKEHTEERRWNTNTDAPTLAEQWLMRVIPDSYTFSSYRDLTPALKTKLSIAPAFFKHPEVINKYLLEFALPQIKVPEERQTSTAAELQAGFKRSLMLSATPGLPEIYPAFLKPENCFMEEAFEAQVIDTLLQLQNRGICKLESTQNPAEFFEQFPPDLLTKMTTLIDRGALLTDFEANEVVASYLGLDKERVASHTAAFFSKTHLHLKSKSTNLKEMDIPGAGLVEALKKQGIRPEQFLLFLFLDLSKTTGTDIKRPHLDHAGLTAGPGQTVTQTIQAAMRERQLLEDNAQSVTWIMFQSLYREIYPQATTDTFDPRQLFYWMIKNEAEEIKTKLINRAYQGIEQVIIGATVWEKDRPWDYAGRTRQIQSISAWDNYEIDSTEKDTASVLRGYADQVARGELNLSKEAKDRIEIIISETAELIATLQDPPKTPLTNEVQQEMLTTLTQEQQIQLEQRMKTQFDTASNFEFKLEQYSLIQDNLTTIFDQLWFYKLLQLPGCNHIKQPELIFSQEHFSVMQQASNTLQQLKPIKLMLVKIMPDNKAQYLACTAAGAEYYSILLTNNLLTEKDPAYALMTTEGDILCTSNNTSPARCKQFTETDDCQRMLTYAHFLNGKINNPIALSQIIKEQGWTEAQYTAMANVISTIHVSHHPVSLLKNETLEKLCGWEKNPSTHTQVTAKIHQRYRKPTDENSLTNTRQLLRPAKTVDKQLYDVIRPIPSPHRALEGYLFGEKILPVATRAEEVQRAIIHSMTNENKIPEKDLAIAKFIRDSTRLVNALEPIAEKLERLQAINTEFKNFDRILETLYEKLQKHTEPEYENLKDLAIKTIGDAYRHFSEGQSIEICKRDLKNELERLSSNAEKKPGPKMQKKFLGRQFTTSSKNALAGIFKESVLILENPHGSNFDNKIRQQIK